MHKSSLDSVPNATDKKSLKRKRGCYRGYDDDGLSILPKSTYFDMTRKGVNVGHLKCTIPKKIDVNMTQANENEFFPDSHFAKEVVGTFFHDPDYVMTSNDKEMNEFQAQQSESILNRNYNAGMDDDFLLNNEVPFVYPNYFDDVMGDQCFDFMENEDDEDCDSSDDDECEAFKKLQEMLNNKDFHSPLNASVIASPCEMLFAITKFWSKYNLPNSGIQDMCKMINSFFDEDILPATRYRIDKLLSADEGIEYHGICPNCEIRIRTFDRKKEKSIYCNSCKKYVSVQDNNFLVTLDTSIDIRKLLESNEDYYHDLMYNRPKERNYLKDIFDGRMYKKFVSSLPKEDCKSFATCVFNSDGSPVFKSSSYSIWPIQISLNEIPPEIRQKKTITWALWFGKNKPNMNTFMGVFVNYINVYSKEGITCTIKSKQMKVKLFALCCCVDSIARSPMQGMTQFNGRYGCNWCLHPGVPIKNKKSNKTTLKFTLLDQEIVLRDSDSTIQHMKEALESGNRVMGVMRPAALINLQKFDIIRGFVPDGMHCLFLGVCRQFATYWFEAVNAPFYIPPKERCKLEKIIKSIKAPNQVSRLSRPLKDRKIWKSREWENWLLHYSLPILRSLNKFTVYADHWQLLVDSCHILLGESIKKTELRHIHEKLELFVSTTQKLYSKAAMTFNIHQLLHLVQSVADWGPLWAHHGYPFEDGNGQLVKTVKSAKGVLHQICRSINFKRCITLMEVHLKDKNSKTLNFCRNLDTKFTTKSFKVTSPSICRYFGKSHKVDDIWVSKLSLLEEFSESFVRMVKNECLFSSTVRKRTDDSFAQTKNGMFIKIEEFIIDSLEKKEYTLCKQINTIGNGNCNKVIAIAKENFVIDTNSIMKIAICINVNDKQYISSVPHMYHY